MRLRAMQQKATDHKSELDELRARRRAVPPPCCDFFANALAFCFMDLWAALWKHPSAESKWLILKAL